MCSQFLHYITTVRIYTALMSALKRECFTFTFCIIRTFTPNCLHQVILTQGGTIKRNKGRLRYHLYNLHITCTVSLVLLPSILLYIYCALLVLVPGTPDGFKGWKRKYHSGYIAAADKLYLLFRCNKNRAARRAQRVRRQPSPMNPTFPPRPCVNGPMAGSASGEEESGSGDTMEGEAASGGQQGQSGIGNGEEQRQEEEENRNRRNKNKRNKKKTKANTRD